MTLGVPLPDRGIAPSDSCQSISLLRRVGQTLYVEQHSEIPRECLAPQHLRLRVRWLIERQYGIEWYAARRAGGMDYDRGIPNGGDPLKYNPLWAPSGFNAKGAGCRGRWCKLSSNVLFST